MPGGWWRYPVRPAGCVGGRGAAVVRMAGRALPRAAAGRIAAAVKGAAVKGSRPLPPQTTREVTRHPPSSLASDTFKPK